MNKIWEFVKGRSEWVYLALILALAVDSALDGDWTGFWISFGIGIFTFAAVLMLKDANTRVDVVIESGGTMPPRTYEEGELAVLAKGYEPIETPYEDPVNEHAKDCYVCRRFLKEPQ